MIEWLHKLAIGFIGVASISLVLVCALFVAGLLMLMLCKLLCT